MATGGTTYQPKNKKRYTKHGFLSKMSTPNGKKIIKKRRQIGRSKLTTSSEKTLLVKKSLK